MHNRFDLDKFYPEAKRILKPAGALAIWGYDVPQFEAPAANKLLNELYSKSLGPYWDAKRQHIDNHLRGQPAYCILPSLNVYTQCNTVQSSFFLSSNEPNTRHGIGNDLHCVHDRLGAFK